MNLWFRLLKVLIASLFRPRLGFTDESELRFRVWPNDIDINIHMNNARYLAVMDLGRFDLIARCGMWRLMFRQRWQAVIGGALVRYRRPLRPFQAFTLKSRVLCWDEKWIYIEHRVEADGALACHTIVRGAFLRSGSVVPPAEVAEALGSTVAAPMVPRWVGQWRDMDGAFEQQPPLKVAREEVTCAR